MLLTKTAKDRTMTPQKTFTPAFKLEIAKR